MAAPEYSELFASEDLSDLNIITAEECSNDAASTEDAEPAAKRRRTAVMPFRWLIGHVAEASAADAEEGAHAVGSASSSEKVLPGHSIVLLGCSTFCKTKLQNWRSSDSGGKLKIRVTVPAGQLAVGELLVQSMYAAQPDVSSCSQEQQLQLLLLADRYGVPKVLAAVLASFAGIAAADLEWQTVMALYSLPPGCCDLDACKSLCAVAGDKLQQELGDLELTWEDAGKQQLLLGLPLQALLQLLRDDRTRIASENTVFYSIHRWWKRQQALVASSGAPAPAEDDMRALLQLVRMQHCSHLYISTAIAESRLAQSCFSPAELALASILAVAGSLPEDQRQTVSAPLLKKSNAVLKFPTWTAQQRPASAMQQLEFQCLLPLQELQAAIETHLDTSKTRGVYGSSHKWQGRDFSPMLEVWPTASAGQEPAIDLGAFVWVSDLAEGSMCRVRHKLEIAACDSTPAGRQQGARQHTGVGPSWFSYKSGQGIGYPKLVKLGNIGTWAAAEAKLRELGLVHSDGCVHMTITVTHVE